MPKPRESREVHRYGFESSQRRYVTNHWGIEGGLAMNTETDLAPLIELLKMEAEQWPTSEAGELSQSELFRRDQILLNMWPEACRRVGLGQREFPPAVIKLWKEEMGPAN
jgi:hypothetical protein